jgi:hypothetical protein
LSAVSNVTNIAGRQQRYDIAALAIAISIRILAAAAGAVTLPGTPDRGRCRPASWIGYCGKISTIVTSKIAVIPAMTVIRTECVPT